jgi:ribonucleoside-diphosphate reductase alpha chain
MYLETRDIGDMMDIYFGAWERGVKTTYYLHMKPRHQAEQSTVKVNKAEEISGGASRKGFGAATVGAGLPANGDAEASSASESQPAAPARRGFGFGGLSTGGDN